MSKFIFGIIFVMISIFSFGQSTFENELSEKVVKLSEAKSPEAFDVLAQELNTVSTKYPSDWRGHYYTALSYLNKGHLLYGAQQDLSQLDQLADAADINIKQADKLSPMNAEIYILKKMSHRLRMMVDPLARYMKEGMPAGEALATAKRLNPDNPRITLLQAQDLYFTPEEFGGSKTDAKAMFKKALEQLKSFKPKTSLDPNWGQKEAEMFLSGE